jgi:hypothetical protein
MCTPNWLILAFAVWALLFALIAEPILQYAGLLPAAVSRVS